MSLQVVEWAAAWPMVLPYFDGSVPAGFPSPAEDYLESPLDLHDFLIDNKAATFLMRVDGDSMRDAGILDGDLLVVDRAVKPDNGCVVVVAVNGEYTVKRLRRGPDCVWLEPANPLYKAIRVSLGGFVKRSLQCQTEAAVALQRVAVGKQCVWSSSKVFLNRQPAFRFMLQHASLRARNGHGRVSDESKRFHIT